MSFFVDLTGTISLFSVRVNCPQKSIQGHKSWPGSPGPAASTVSRTCRFASLYHSQRHRFKYIIDRRTVSDEKYYEGDIWSESILTNQMRQKDVKAGNVTNIWRIYTLLTHNAKIQAISQSQTFSIFFFPFEPRCKELPSILCFVLNNFLTWPYHDSVILNLRRLEGS